MLQISDYKRKAAAGGHGFEVDFTITGAEKGKAYVIYQNVRSIIEVRGPSGGAEKAEYTYVEAWNYRKDRKMQDTFLVPKMWRHKLLGSYVVSADAWVAEAPMDPSLKLGKGDDPWGRLHGREKPLVAPAHAIRREVEISWNNRGKSRSSMVRGRDLMLKVVV